MSNHRAKPVGRLGDRSHPSGNAAATGSLNVLVGNKNVLRENDFGVSRWRAVDGATHILVNNKRIHRVGDPHSNSEQAEGHVYTLGGTSTTGVPSTSLTAAESDDFILFCSHKVGTTHRCGKPQWGQFDVVVSKEDLADVVKILYKQSAGEAPLKVTSNTVSGIQLTSGPKERGGRYARYDLRCVYDDTKKPSIVSYEFWDRGNRYYIEGASRTLTIVARPPHVWKFELRFPSLAGCKVGAKLEAPLAYPKPAGENNHRKIVVDAEVSRWRPLKMQQRSATVEISATEVKTEAEKKRQINDAVSLTKDGVSVGDGGLYGYFSAISLVNGILKILKEIQDSVPQVGWYAEWDIQLLQGAFSVEWQWREYIDHQAFLWIESIIDLKLVTISFEFGFGLRMVGFKAQAFVRIDGSVGIEAKGERDSPNIPSLSVNVYGEISGTVGARVEGGNAVKIEVNASAGIVISGRLGIDEKCGFGIKDGKVNWTGIKGTITVSGEMWGLTGEYVRQGTLLEESFLGAWEFPASETNSASDVSLDDIKSILKDRFYDGFDVRVEKDSGSFWKANERVDMDTVVNEIAVIIDDIEDVRRDAKSVEAIAVYVRQQLDKIRGWGKRLYPIVNYDAYRTVIADLRTQLATYYIDDEKRMRRELGF